MEEFQGTDDPMATQDEAALALANLVDMQVEGASEANDSWATLTSDPDLDPSEAAVHLAAIYQAAKTAIRQGGTEDYRMAEFAFEVLVKVATALKANATAGRTPNFVAISEAADAELVSALTELNAEYDTLLQTVEIEEAQEPGVSGNLRAYMLQSLFHITGYEQMSGKALMELMDNDVAGAVSLTAFVLRCDYAHFSLQSTAARCLLELTTADSIFLAAGSAAGAQYAAMADEQTGMGGSIQQLTAMLNDHVNTLLKAIIQYEIVDAFGRCICQHQMSHARTDVIIKFFLTCIHNCLMYCSANKKDLRQHLATTSTIVQDIFFPYVDNILPALYEMPDAGPHNVEWQNLRATLQTFVVVTFNIKKYREQFQLSDMINRILDVPNLVANAKMLELLVKLCVNVDVLAGADGPRAVETIKLAVDALAPADQERLKRRLAQSQDSGHSLPMVKTASPTSKAFTELLGGDAPIMAPTAEDAQAAQRQQQQAMLGRQWEEEDAAAPAAAAEPGSATDGAGVCALTHVLLTDPIKTPAGHVYERSALEDWLQYSQTDPIAGTPLTLAECVADAAAAQGNQAAQMAAVTEKVRAEQPESLLGEVPEIPQAPPSSGGAADKKKGKLKISRAALTDAPEHFRCAIDKKVMTDPVRLNGHVFERKTLLKWVEACGQVCPVSGEPISMDDMEPDTALKKEIVKYLKELKARQKE